METASGAEGTGVEAATIGLPGEDSSAGGFASEIVFSCVSSNGVSSGLELLPVDIEDEDMK